VFVLRLVLILYPRRKHRVQKTAGQPGPGHQLRLRHFQPRYGVAPLLVDNNEPSFLELIVPRLINLDRANAA